MDDNAGQSSEYHTDRKPHGRIKVYTAIVVVLLVFIAIGAVIGIVAYTRQSHAQQTSTNPANSLAPPKVWALQQDQTFAQSSTGVFSIKWITITPEEFHFFYAFRYPGQETPRVTAISSLTSNPGGSTTLTTSIQSLGQLGSFHVGVIHVALLERANQVITLQIKPSARSAIVWKLAPLQQLLKDPLKGSWYEFYVDQSQLPQVWWSGTVTKERVAYFKSMPPANRSYVFVRTDDPVQVSLITKEEYLTIAGPANFHP